MSGRALQPCGTAAAWRRHKRNHEPVDAACERAGRAAEAEYKRRRVSVDSAPVFVADGDAFTLTLSADDWRVFAAACGDRGYSLAQAPRAQVGASEGSKRAYAVQKRILAELRANGAMS